jgi:hypothetical protein
MLDGSGVTAVPGPVEVPVPTTEISSSKETRRPPDPLKEIVSLPVSVTV